MKGKDNSKMKYSTDGAAVKQGAPSKWGFTGTKKPSGSSYHEQLMHMGKGSSKGK